MIENFYHICGCYAVSIAGYMTLSELNLFLHIQLISKSINKSHAYYLLSCFMRYISSTQEFHFEILSIFILDVEQHDLELPITLL
ncbi:hypothetical protein BLOT_007121 [Blomia tropicalis]|nr:hypothetical protein BLOT_007121 [Blomia tropicalis]